jgi:hypothetical protein
MVVKVVMQMRMMAETGYDDDDDCHALILSSDQC